MIHPADEEALQTIDAAVFTGDPDVIRERLTYFMMRWQKALDRRDRGVQRKDSRPNHPGRRAPDLIAEFGPDRRRTNPSRPPDDEPCRECGKYDCYCPNPHPPGGIPT